MNGCFLSRSVYMAVFFKVRRGAKMDIGFDKGYSDEKRICALGIYSVM